MDRSSTEMTVADYFAAYHRGEVTVNPDYQRSDKVWPEAAKSFLIESIILGYPIPKLSLNQITDVRTRSTKKEVIDGQQRSRAIWTYLENRFRLSPSSEVTEAAGRKYEELPERIQGQILSYSLSFDLFINTTQEEVREVFRRINSFTVPLNAEEQRYAQYQGSFKWFIYRITRDYDTFFTASGMFSSKQLVRLSDTKWLAEVTHALLYGITTTNKTTLNRLYLEYNKSFPREEELENRLRGALDTMNNWEPLHQTSLFKPFIGYSLALAIIHVTNPVEALQDSFAWSEPTVINLDPIAPTLSAMAEAAETAEPAGQFADFVKASTTGTNVKKARTDRFVWLCKALTGKI